MKGWEPALARRPAWVLAAGVTVALTIVMSYLRLSVYPQRVMPLTCAIPLLIALWHRDRLLLWTMAACLMAVSAVKNAWLIPDDYFADGLQQALFAMMLLLNIVVPAWVIHLILGYRETLERSNASLVRANMELEAHGQQRKLSQESIRRSEERYHNLFTTMSESFALHELIYDAEGNPCDSRFLEVNPAFERATGLKAVDLVGRTLREALPDTEPVWFERFLRVAMTGEADHFLEYHQSTGRWYEVFVSRPAPRQFAVIFFNVTQRREAEQALRQAQALLAGALDATPMLVACMDREFNFLLVNRAYAQADDRQPEFFPGKNHFALYPHAENEAIFRQVVASGQPYHVFAKPFEYHEHPDRGVTYWDWSVVPVKDAAGSVERLVMTLLDVTPQVRAEELLRESETRYRTLFTSMNEGFSLSEIICDDNGNAVDYRFLEVNPAWGRLVNIEPAVAVGRTVRQLIPAIEPHWIQVYGEIALRGGETRFEGYVRELGKWYQVFAWQSGKGRFAHVISDITQRKEIERERERLAESLRQKVHELERAQEQLLQAKSAAEAASQAKSHFLANMSHELRTPMNAILGMIDVALPKTINPIVQDCLQTAKSSADLLLMLVNDLLDSAKIESGKLELEASPFSLRRMLDQTTQILSVHASQKGLSFSPRIPDAIPDAVIGDRTRLQQVLLNLAGNAIKFTERGDVEIHIRAATRNDEAHLEFAVRDTGIGIAPAVRERLFQPFAQGDVSIARRFGGTGLGLVITKSIVELLGGRIWVESEQGKGSTFFFTVRLPLAKELPTDFPATADLSPASRTPLRVLLVEDNPANQKLATYVLQDRGHVVEIARNGQEAVDLTELNRYDVILMDVQMPGINGLEATTAIRQRERGGKRMPIIALTAHAMTSDRDRCLAAGMDAYLSKPVDAQEMTRLVEGLASGLSPTTESDRETLQPPQNSLQATAPIFDPGQAITRCYDNPDMLRKMIGCFLDEVDDLFPRMRAAWKKDDLVEVGRLGHRMKGTLACLGAQPAEEAATRAERFSRASGGTSSEAEDAINALERECLALKAALREHLAATEPRREDSP